jgi:hypothetical protein
MLWKTIEVENNKRALIFRRNRLDNILEAGQHKISELNGKVRIEIHSAVGTDSGFDTLDVNLKSMMSTIC